MAVRSPKKISYQEFLHREYENFHAPYQEETEFFETIKNGNLKKLEALLVQPFHKKEGFGILSRNSLQNLKYHFTITTAMVARYCISGGMSQAESFSLSDYFIRLADEADSLSEVSGIHNEMCRNYALRMKENQRSRISSPAVRTCINYIYEHLHTRITLPVLCAQTNLSGPYLSRLFKKETGYSISAYIQAKKLETAKSMLVNSAYSIAEISASMSFPSQSYFSNLLKKNCGMTPKQFRSHSIGQMSLDT